jgi:hypothetical protein
MPNCANRAIRSFTSCCCVVGSTEAIHIALALTDLDFWRTKSAKLREGLISFNNPRKLERVQGKRTLLTEKKTKNVAQKFVGGGISSGTSDARRASGKAGSVSLRGYAHLQSGVGLAIGSARYLRSFVGSLAWLGRRFRAQQFFHSRNEGAGFRLVHNPYGFHACWPPVLLRLSRKVCGAE